MSPSLRRLVHSLIEADRNLRAQQATWGKGPGTSWAGVTRHSAERRKTMRWLQLCLRVALLVSVTCGGAKRNDFYSKAVVLRVKNPIPLPRIDEPALLDVPTIKEREPAFNPKALVLLADGKEVASQANDLDADGQRGHCGRTRLCTQCREDADLTLCPLWRSRTFVCKEILCGAFKSGGRFIDRKYVGGQIINVRSLRVPAEHTDHSEFIRYEGPGWESDRIGYRFYLDWRNAIDLFGKKVSHIVLPTVGQDGFNSLPPEGHMGHRHP